MTTSESVSEKKCDQVNTRRDLSGWKRNMHVDRYFFFSSRRRHTRCSRDWSSDVCSSDLPLKNLFQSAATTASTMQGPLREFYQARVAKGMQPALARLTLARKMAAIALILRSEERRVGKECRSRWSPYH